MAKIALVIAVALMQHVDAAVVKSRAAAEHEHVVTLPMWMYKKDCFKKRPISVSSNAAAMLQYVPGAGIEKFKPFETVLKDGFMEIDCVMDYMYYHGDKFGDARGAYKLEDVSNVSIVHYDAFVKKEDRQPMTQSVCFEFCRTVPNMGFFGLLNGRNCYCAPYYKQMAGDSSQCDAPCPGENTVMCGGKSKSSVFALHHCDSTKADLSDSDKKAESMVKEMEEKVKKAEGLSKDMQKAGADLQKTFGAVGDSAATNLMQKAKVSAGKLANGAETVTALAGDLKDLSKKAKAIKDFKDPTEVTEAERIMEDIAQSMAKSAEATGKLEKKIELASPSPDEKDVAAEYFPVMYFVNKKYETVPTTCGGDLLNDPIVGESPDGCASECNRNFDTCVGFSYFGPEKLCFLFTKLQTAFYYTGCKKSSFLQAPAAKKAKAPDVTCYAKLSRYEGTTLKPDPSGKCKQCLRKATKANRCYK